MNQFQFVLKIGMVQAIRQVLINKSRIFEGEISLENEGLLLTVSNIFGIKAEKLILGSEFKRIGTNPDFALYLVTNASEQLAKGIDPNYAEIEAIETVEIILNGNIESRFGGSGVEQNSVGMVS